METSTRKQRNLPWKEAIRLHYCRGTADAPIHVSVAEVDSKQPGIKKGDELLIRKFSVEQVVLSRADSVGKDEIFIPIRFKEPFILQPRFPLNHTFHSVKEVLDSLPAVSSLIYPTESFTTQGQAVSGLERLRIIDRILDPSKSIELLCVQSMKTEKQHFLESDLKVGFVQLSQECFKCSVSGVSVSDMVHGWKPGDPPMRVTLQPQPAKKNPPSPGRSQPKRKPSQQTDDETDGAAYCSDRLQVPLAWWDDTLLIKPDVKIKVTNVSSGTTDLLLTDSSVLTVRVLSDCAPESEQLRHLPRCLSTFVGALADLPMEKSLTNEYYPLPVLAVGGSLPTTLRSHPMIKPGNRLVIQQAKKPVKILMKSSEGQSFLVDMSYTGLFKRISSDKNHNPLTVEQLLNEQFPCLVEVLKGDASLAYDQLQRKTRMSVKDIVTESTLIASVISADGNSVSEKAIEIPVKRTNLSVRVLELSSCNTQFSTTPNAIKTLPLVELINDKHLPFLQSGYKDEEIHEYAPMSPQQATMKPPARPPKPEKFKVENQGNNSKSTDHSPSKFSQALLRENELFLEAQDRRTAENQQTKREKSSAARGVLKPLQHGGVPRSEKPNPVSPSSHFPKKQRAFHQMHDNFAPFRADEVQAEMKLKETKRNLISEEILKCSQLGTYQKDLLQNEVGKKGAAAIWKRTEKPAYVKMSNPGYETSLEVTYANTSPETQESSYDFAESRLGKTLRHCQLPSLCDDDDDYENVSSLLKRDSDSDDYEDYSRETIADWHRPDMKSTSGYSKGK